MKLWKTTNLLAAILALAAVASGCTVLAPQPDRTKYFVVAATANPGSSAASPALTAGNATAIGVGPIQIPSYLDRPEVVTRVSETELSVSDTNRWGEPLAQGVSRAVAQNLAGQLPNLRIVQFPWSSKVQIDYRVKVDFTRLECTSDGNAIVQASWTIQRGTDGIPIESSTTSFANPAGANERTASAALSRGIGQVSSEIARELAALAEARGNKRSGPST
jgi:uncharacterized lipoprotein YmbA